MTFSGVDRAGTLMAWMPHRRCTGHTADGGLGVCSSAATRVCTGQSGMQWYACADDAHATVSFDGERVVHTESIESFMDGVIAADAEARLLNSKDEP